MRTTLLAGEPEFICVRCCDKRFRSELVDTKVGWKCTNTDRCTIQMQKALKEHNA